MVRSITSSAPYSAATCSIPARTVAGEPRMRRRPDPPRGRERVSRYLSASSTGGTGTRRPWRRSENAIFALAESRSASSSLSAQMAMTATAIRGAGSRSEESKRAR